MPHRRTSGRTLTAVSARADRPRHVAFLWLMSARARVLCAIAAGVIAGVVAGFLLPWQAAILVSWDATAVITVLWVYLTASRFNADETQEYASREDDSRLSAQFLLLAASLASLIGVGLDLHKASHTDDTTKVLLTALGLATVVASWFVLHTVFLLRYAHEYYAQDDMGGIDFKEGPDFRPEYRDFAYVAFTVGMTWQVSDTDVTDRRIRRTVLQHSLFSYMFGAVILATLINVIASLLQ
jgi:uncharacterized membrane protein